MIRITNCFLANGYLFVATYFILLVLWQPAWAAPVNVKNIKHLFTIKGEKSQPLSLPSDIAIDENGYIYVVDSGNHRVAVFDQDGDHVLYISRKGKRKSETLNPVGIDVAGNHVYLADKDNHRIQVFDRKGSYKQSILISDGSNGIRPVDVAVSEPKKRIYVTGNNNHKIMVYDYSGKRKHQWGGEGTNRGELRYPATISLFNENAYVVDVLNSRVQIFNPAGELQAITGQWGVLPGQLFRPKGVAHDTKGNIYISDSYLGVIQVFSNDTRFSYALGNQGKPYKFNTPAGITVDKRNRLYVCEMLDNKVSVFSLGP